MRLRLKALLVHLLISTVIFLGVMAVVYWSWFPGALIKLGALQGLAIVVLVDLVLGPLLTFIVFNPQKKSLKFDLLVIALLQLAGLTYGLVQLESQRIVAHVLMDDQLHIVHKAEMVEAGNTVTDIKERFGAVPVAAFYNIVEDPSLVKVELGAIASLEGQPQYQLKYYLPMSDAKNDNTLKRRLDFWLQRLEKDDNGSCYWVVLNDKYAEGRACLSQAGKVLKIKTY
jgi:hypothetical protein